MEITARAAERIRQIVAKDGRESAFLRILVEGGGCQGFRYEMSVSCDAMDGDEATVRDGAELRIDRSSAPLVAGSTLDWTSSMAGDSFQVSNPNAASSCGCGTSFSV